jgi:hypothetical protein
MGAAAEGSEVPSGLPMHADLLGFRCRAATPGPRSGVIQSDVRYGGRSIVPLR